MDVNKKQSLLEELKGDFDIDFVLMWRFETVLSSTWTDLEQMS